MVKCVLRPASYFPPHLPADRSRHQALLPSAGQNINGHRELRAEVREMRTVILSLVVLAALTSSQASAAIITPNGGTIAEVDFEKHIMGLLGRTGCNMG